jgi:hypothetical protein
MAVFHPSLFQARTFSGGEPTKEGKESASTQLEWLNKARKGSKSLFCLSRTSTFLASAMAVLCVSMHLCDLKSMETSVFFPGSAD